MDISEELKKPFSTQDIEWRVQQAGLKQDGEIYCMVLAYVQARAIQERLDFIFGFDGWSDEYRNGNSDNNIICRLGVKTKDGWIYKENGASETHVEPFKGGISGAFKRVAASGFGIGRYLYNLKTEFAKTSKTPVKGWNKASYKDKKTSQYTNYWWETPILPDWALPELDKNVDGMTIEEQFEDRILEITEPNQDLFRQILAEAENKRFDKISMDNLKKVANDHYLSIINSERG